MKLEPNPQLEGKIRDMCVLLTNVWSTDYVVYLEAVDLDYEPHYMAITEPMSYEKATAWMDKNASYLPHMVM